MLYLICASIWHLFPFVFCSEGLKGVFIFVDYQENVRKERERSTNPPVKVQANRKIGHNVAFHVLPLFFIIYAYKIEEKKTISNH